VLAQTSTLAEALFDRLMTAEQRARFLPPFLADQRYHLALAEHEADRDSALGINYHRPQASGAVTVDLEGGFGGVLLARPGEDGVWETRCVFTIEEGADFLGLVVDDAQ